MISPSTTQSSTDPPQTPDKRSSTKSRVTQTSKSSASNKIVAPDKEIFISERLSAHGLLQDSMRFDSYGSFKSDVKSILLAQRGSVLQPNSAQSIMRKLKLYAVDNEDTFLGMVLPVLIRSTYTNKISPELQNTTFGTEMGSQDRILDIGDLQDGGTYAAQFWEDEGVVIGINKNLHKDLLPYAWPDEDLDKMLKKDRYNNMSTPRPDRIYGLKTDLLTIPPNLGLELHVLLRVCPNQQHPFFIIEGRSNQGDPHGAQNQACRGGGELVHAARRLRNSLGMPEVSSGPDTHTFVFSGTLTPDTLVIWVHWAEVIPGERTQYHMNQLKGWYLKDEDSLYAMRNALHHILEWGCDLEKRGLRTLHDRILIWQHEQDNQRKQAKTGSPAKKRQRTDGRLLDRSSNRLLVCSLL